MFITLEGGEGTGKTTQIARLAGSLRAAGHDVVTTREPGGTPAAEKIRDLLVRRDGGDWTPWTECLLLYAARVQHVETLIRPALAAGKIVISDRFADSTRAYQSGGFGVDPARLGALDELSLGDFKPDLTLILDIDPETGLRRSGHRLNAENSAEDKYEALDLSFHQRLRRAYLDIAASEPARCTVIDAAGDIDGVAATILTAVLTRLS